MLQYDTLYQSLKKVTAEWHAGHVQWQYSWLYFKFFDDGTFIYASYSSDDFEKINSGFNKESVNTFHLRGNYCIEKDVYLKLQFNNGVEVMGAFTGTDKLIINGKMAWELYSPIRS